MCRLYEMLLSNVIFLNIFLIHVVFVLLLMMMMMMMMMMMITIICFCGMVDRRKRVTLFPAGTIVRDLHHHESSTRCEQDLNLRRT